MNKIELIGRVSKEPELRYTPSNTAVSIFDIAVPRKFKNSKGEYDVDFFNCKAFGKLADTISQYVKKGDKLGLTGSVYFSKYQDKDGNNRISIQVSIDDIDFLEHKKEVKEVKKEEKDLFAEFGEETIDEDLPF